jgi:hypothetical protein
MLPRKKTSCNINNKCPAGLKKMGPLSSTPSTVECFFCFFILFLHWPGPRPHIPFPPELILYVNLVAMGPVHLSPVTWPQAFRYWYSLTPLMHIVAQLRPIDLHNLLGQIPESSQFLGASKLPLLE